MSRSLIITLLIVAVTTISMLAAACAPAAAPAAKPPATTAPAAPAATAPSAPAATAPAAPAADKPITTSFTATTYTNDQYGISVMYPKKWATEPATAPAIFSAREGGQVPNLVITIFNAATLQKELDAVWAAVPMKNIKYVTQGQKGTLRDGITATQYDVYTSDYPGGIKLKSFGTAIQKGDKIISFAVTTIDGLEDEALYKEVFSTIVSK